MPNSPNGNALRSLARSAATNGAGANCFRVSCAVNLRHDDFCQSQVGRDFSELNHCLRAIGQFNRGREARCAQYLQQLQEFAIRVDSQYADRLFHFAPG